MKRIATGLAALLATSALVTPAAAQTLAPRPVDAFVAQSSILATTPDAVQASCDAYLAKAAELKALAEGGDGPATFDSTFQAMDDLYLVVFSGLTQADLVMNTAVAAEVRQAAGACAQRTNDAVSEIILSRPLYDRLKAIDPANGDSQQRHLLARAIRDAELAGTDRDEATRRRILELQREITAASLAFEQNIANGRRTLKASPAELEGVPVDWLAAHPVGDDGMVEISTDYPDLIPVMTYSNNADLRRRLFEMNLNRAWPENDEALGRIVRARHALAQTLGRPSFAHVDLSTRMVNTPEKAWAFIDGLSRSAEASGRRDLELMSERLRRDDPAVEGVPPWSAVHAEQLLRKEVYDVDPQEVRQYFAYNNVRDGIFQLTEDLFGVEIRPWETEVWADGVQAFEMYENGELIGQFYLDNHPREGKFNHARVSIIRTGIEGRAVPVASLICNFPAGDHSTGLMEHGDVETFLHEFGHLLHVLFSGKQDYIQQNPFLGLEADFGEAPSTMLENWVWDYETLSRFARNAEGETIPEDLVARMNRARGFAEAYFDRRQMGLAAVSLDLYDGEPPADLTQAYLTANNRYSMSPMEGIEVHPQASFGHLSSYGAAYYTYLWSKAISSDLFTRFEAEGLRDTETARRYREMILAPGSSKPAAQLVEDFLERPMSLDAYERRLSQ